MDQVNESETGLGTVNGQGMDMVGSTGHGLDRVGSTEPGSLFNPLDLPMLAKN